MENFAVFITSETADAGTFRHGKAAEPVVVIHPAFVLFLFGKRHTEVMVNQVLGPIATVVASGVETVSAHFHA